MRTDQFELVLLVLPSVLCPSPASISSSVVSSCASAAACARARWHRRRPPPSSAAASVREFLLGQELPPPAAEQPAAAALRRAQASLEALEREASGEGGGEGEGGGAGASCRCRCPHWRHVLPHRLDLSFCEVAAAAAAAAAAVGKPRVKSKNHKFVCYPSKKNRKQMIQKIKSVLKDSRYKMKERLNKIQTIYRGWWNYHQFSDMGQINLWSIQRWVYLYLTKSTKMTYKERIKYLKSVFNGHSYRVNRHSAARGNRSIYDGDLVYWSKKNSQYYTGPLVKALRSQAYKCNACGLRFSGADWIELHHKNGNNQDFKLSNVEALHRTCHQHQPVHREILLQRKRR